MAKTAGARRKAKEKGGTWETARFLLLLFAFTLLLRTFVAAPFVIPSGSMLPRMLIGDYLFVAKWPYGYSQYSFPFGLGRFEGRVLQSPPKRGDVIVFRDPAKGEDIVKRLVGLPGDRVQMRGGALFLNGKQVSRIRVADFLMPVTPNSPCRQVDRERAKKPIAEKGRLYCPYSRYREVLPGGRAYDILDQAETAADDTETFRVPEGHYFMLGDNRDDSLDSRFPRSEGGVGYLADEQLVGRALVTFFSTDGSSEWLKPWTWFSAARWERIGGTY
jgi:signal peptidase I